MAPSAKSVAEEFEAMRSRMLLHIVSNSTSDGRVALKVIQSRIGCNNSLLLRRAFPDVSSLFAAACDTLFFTCCKQRWRNSRSYSPSRCMDKAAWITEQSAKRSSTSQPRPFILSRYTFKSLRVASSFSVEDRAKYTGNKRMLGPWSVICNPIGPTQPKRSPSLFVWCVQSSKQPVSWKSPRRSSTPGIVNKMDTVSPEAIDCSRSNWIPAGGSSKKRCASPRHWTGACLSLLPLLLGLLFLSWLTEGRCSTGTCCECISTKERPGVNWLANCRALNCFTFWRFKGPPHSPTCSTRSCAAGSCRKHQALLHCKHLLHRAMRVRNPLSVLVPREECMICFSESHRCAEALKVSSAGISSRAHSCQSLLLFPPASLKRECSRWTTCSSSPCWSCHFLICLLPTK